MLIPILLLSEFSPCSLRNHTDVSHKEMSWLRATLDKRVCVTLIRESDTSAIVKH